LTADIFIGHAKVPVPWDEVVAQGRLRWIQSSAAGLDHCLTPAVIASDILVTSASGLFANQVAEQTLALLLGLYRGMPTFFRAQQEREFVRRPTLDLHGRTVGIVGFGGNGRRIAEVLASFNTRIIATDCFPIDKPPHVDQLRPAEQLDQLLSQSDVVVLAVPLNADTHHLIDAGRLAAMKPDATLINVARGPVVDETALAAALANGGIGRAGLDVCEVEPLPAESPLWDMPNVLITPHVGAQSAKRVDDTTSFACENMANYLAGRPLLNLVDKQLGFPVRK
ncbi:MAG: D-2-hydroxyacid dehydrogenase, partial [Pirellulaceae bacterium]|nr:D-2-hydroxyacid dehydrogenase [Pirellulaceae bacterium]